VTITGTNLSGVSVKFGSTTAAHVTSNGPNQIIAKTKPHAPGTVKITVKDAGGTAVSTASFKFT
jgi:hypothetical protein